MKIKDNTIKVIRPPNINIRRRQRPGPPGQDAIPETDKDLSDAAYILQMIEEGQVEAKIPPRDNSRDKIILRGKERLSFEEEAELAYRVQNYSDIDARNCLVMANIGLVHLVANQYARHMIRYEDLLQEGTLGLIRATETFEANRGVRFSTYGVYWIRAKIQRLLQKLEKEEIPSIIGAAVSKDSSGKKKRPRAKKLSIERSLEEENSRSLSEIIPTEDKDPEHLALEQERNILVRQILNNIAEDLHDERLYIIIENRLLTDEPETLSKVGRKLNLSREGARLLENRLLKFARQKLKKWKLSPSLS